MRDGEKWFDGFWIKSATSSKKFFLFHVYFTVRWILFELGRGAKFSPSSRWPRHSIKQNINTTYLLINVICAEFGISPNADFRFTKGDNHGPWKCFRIFHQLRLIQNTFQISIQNGKVWRRRRSCFWWGTLFLISKTQKRETSMNISLCPVLARPHKCWFESN